MKYLLLAITFLSLETFALDPVQQAALDQTKQQLTSPSQRAALINESKEAKKVDAITTITVMGNKEYKEEMYAISAEILDWVVRQENPQALMERYKADPVNFLKEMPPAQAARIKALADALEAKRRNNRLPASVAQP